MVKKIIIFCLIWILPASAIAREGFFRIEQLPLPILQEFKIDPAVVSRAAMQTGWLMRNWNHTLKDRAEWLALIHGRCESPYNKPWYESYCIRLKALHCDNGCKFVDENANCGGIFVKHPKTGEIVFATARHCAYQDQSADDFGNREYYARIKNPANGQVGDVGLKLTNLVDHFFPIDISVFKIDGTPPFALAPAKLAPIGIANGQSVFGIAYPYLNNRTQSSGDYPLDGGGMRVTIGRIIEANPDRKSFCRFTQEVEIAKPENWVLERDCSHTPYFTLPYVARQEYNLILTDTDMTYRVSGSPLFDATGNLIAIGSSIQSSDPNNYHPRGYAIYSKSENLWNLIRIPMTETK